MRRDGVDFNDAVRRRVFTELGRGRLDVPGLLAALRDIGYDGWLMVEQDSTWLPPPRARASAAPTCAASASSGAKAATIPGMPTSPSIVQAVQAAIVASAHLAPTSMSRPRPRRASGWVA